MLSKLDITQHIRRVNFNIITRPYSTLLSSHLVKLSGHFDTNYQVARHICRLSKIDKYVIVHCNVRRYNFFFNNLRKYTILQSNKIDRLVLQIF